MHSVEEQLEEARKSLLDMTLRNKLLNFRELKRSTTEVIDEVPSQVYENLVLESEPMAFLPAEEHPDYNDLDELAEEEAVSIEESGTHLCKLCEDEGEAFQDRQGFLDHLEERHEATLEGENEELTPEQIEGLWQLPEIEDEGLDRHQDDKLQTPYTESGLQKRLYHTGNRAEALVQDAGYNALHLAIGFLEWTEADAHSSPHRAPLILVPVELKRKGARSSFKVLWNEEEVVGNLSLRHKLKEQGFKLPIFEQPDERSGIRDYLEEVEEAIQEWEDWSVVPEMHLGFFDFAKFVMYEDLDPENWEDQKPADHPLVRALLDSDAELPDPGAFDQEKIDELLGPEDVHHVLDADPSQIAAVEDVKRGRNLVIQGPPGTGKSQTIVNMVAELLAEGKTVLFVSEKLAALEVVKERLDQVAIGDFCLELHSHRTSKSEFLQELERLASLGSYSPDSPRETFNRLEKRKTELNAYAEALGSPYGQLQRTPYDLIGMKEEARRHFEEDGREAPRFQLTDPPRIKPSQHEDARAALSALQARLRRVYPIKDHPWYGCSPGQVYPGDVPDIEGVIREAVRAVEEARDAAENLESECRVRSPQSISGLEDAIEAAGILRDSEPVDAEVLQNSSWNTAPAEADDIIALLERFHELKAGVGSRTNIQHVDREPPELLTEYRELHASWTRLFKPRWYRLKGRLKTLYGGEMPEEEEAVIRDLEHLIELDSREEEIQGKANVGRELFGSFWKGSSTDPARLEKFSGWIVRFRRKILDDVLEESSMELVTRGVAEQALSETIQQGGDRLAVAEVKLEALQDRLGLDTTKIFHAPLDEVTFDAWASHLQGLLSNMDELDRWAQFDVIRSQTEETIASPILEHIDEDSLEPADMIPCYRANLADNLLDAAFRDRDVLATFDGSLHEERIESFQELDERTFELNRERVLAALVDGTPRLMDGASKSSQTGVLVHEFNKKRMHKPIRLLLQEAGPLIQKMKPCFMMSPLSVAKYIDPETLEFDVVIFDEASQVPPEDALGAILRGSQLVVLGDRKQLPPTDFFNQIVDHRESDDEFAFSVRNIESVLDLCESAFPTKRLKWHYRSRHESLIAVSNQEFYKNDLVIYPSPVQDTDHLGLKFHHLPETTYDRGGSSVNREEAREVAMAAVEHYRETPELTLGVGTFSTAQQEAVLEEVELLRKENPEVDQYFSKNREEPFFVKNLERIQGDERDVILISVGYGYDSQGSFSHHFGPLNNDGGWRRLNVLITRARRRCVVFSNFSADSIDMSRTNARGVKSLKVFLDYAENRNLDTITDVGDDPESPFERSVMRFLQDEGYRVHAQVGAAGFRIDLAIPDPEHPGRYVLGIECDGASYHSSPVARERDRQRQRILEDRGWELHRIWSTDWFRNRDQTQERLTEAVEDALARDPLEGSGKENGASRRARDERENGSSGPSLEAIQDDGYAFTLEDLADPYIPAENIGFVGLGRYDVRSTRRAVAEIVAQEGPIHRDLLRHRLRDASNIDRLGQKVQRTIDQAIREAERRAEIETRHEFLYPPHGSVDTVRQRDGSGGKIEWIPPEEIKEGIRRILEVQHATPDEDLIKQVAYLLGFSRTGRKISNRVEAIIAEMQDDEILGVNKGRIELQTETS